MNVVNKVYAARMAYDEATKHGPSDETRRAASQVARFAWTYAVDIDTRPHDVTRAGVLRDSCYARLYAHYVDRGPRDDTRKAACEDPWEALYYAVDVDKCAHEDTRKAAALGVGANREYRKLFAEAKAP